MMGGRLMEEIDAHAAPGPIIHLFPNMQGRAGHVFCAMQAGPWILAGPIQTPDRMAGLLDSGKYFRDAAGVADALRAWQRAILPDGLPAVAEGLIERFAQKLSRTLPAAVLQAVLRAAEGHDQAGEGGIREGGTP